MDEQIVRENELLEQQRVCMLGQKLVQAGHDEELNMAWVLEMQEITEMIKEK